MSVRELLRRLEAAPPGGDLDFPGIRQEILHEYDKAATAEDRVLCLAMFKVVMDTVERQLENRAQQGNFPPTQLAKFKEARRNDYQSLIAQEALVGENVCVETLDAITQREIAAGRMAEDNSLRKIAADGMRAPHLTRSELLAIEAEKQQQNKAAIAQPMGRWHRALKAFFKA